MRPSTRLEDSVDSASFRQTVAQFATGVTVIATESGGSVHAMTANSFTSLSLSPPLVLFCAGKQTRMSVRVREADRFAVNILARGQEDVSSYFAGAWKQRCFIYLDPDYGWRDTSRYPWLSAGGRDPSKPMG